MHKIIRSKASVVANTAVTSRLYLITLAMDDMPALVEPGQFVHMQIPGMESHILRRPFSVYHVDTEKNEMTILYQIVGFGSNHLASIEKGTEVDLIGPIGNPWKIVPGTKTALIVAGGVGGAPLYMHTKALVEAGVNVDVVMGAQTKEAHVCLPLYTELLGSEPRVATDDGSYGYHGFVTGLVEEAIKETKYDYVAICGPEPMMKNVSKITMDAGLNTFVSMEKRMACGIGACLSCVVATDEGNKRACIDGPIFNAKKVVW